MIQSSWGINSVRFVGLQPSCDCSNELLIDIGPNGVHEGLLGELSILHAHEALQPKLHGIIGNSSKKQA